ncbi:MAG: GntR family transcriptional regulator [Proteobacteria bacterium]|nr:GntR family transcriptional regulator [Pseudomonadota bacterium]
MAQEHSLVNGANAGLPVFQSRRLYKQIADALAERIHSGIFAPGSHLPSERDLAQQMGVSRPSVREALIALEVMGLVEVRVGDGVLVCDRRASIAEGTDTENSPLEQLQARMLLEGEVAGLAAENVTPEQLAVLDASLLAMEGMINDRTRFLEEDQRFHMAVVVASGSQTLIDLVEFLWQQRTLPVYRAFEKHFTGAAEQTAVLEEHRAIVEAIRQGDSRKARSAMRRHIDRVRKQFTK